MGVYLHNETIILQKWSGTPKYFTTDGIKKEIPEQISGLCFPAG